MLCSCWNRGWAEVKVRRPTGSVSWLMRVQNQLDLLSSLDPLLTSHLWRDIGIAEMNYPDFVSECSSVHLQVPSTCVSSRRSSSASSFMPESGDQRETLVVTESMLPTANRDTNEPALVEVEDSERDVHNTLSECTSKAKEEGIPTSNPISMAVRNGKFHQSTSASSELCEFLPPLLSYEGHTKSPSLHSDSTLLNEQQQVYMYASIYNICTYLEFMYIL